MKMLTGVDLLNEGKLSINNQMVYCLLSHIQGINSMCGFYLKNQKKCRIKLSELLDN